VIGAYFVWRAFTRYSLTRYAVTRVPSSKMDGNGAAAATDSLPPSPHHHPTKEQGGDDAMELRYSYHIYYIWR
jgi:hypothetical protein